MRRFARLLLAVSFLAVTFGCGSPATTVHTAAPLPRFDAVGQGLSDAEQILAIQQYLQHLQQKAAEQAQRVAQARAQARRVQAATAGHVIHAAAYSGPHPCGGDLPPCWVMLRESGGSPTAWNATGCVERNNQGVVIHRGCGGKWQFSYSTWARYGGFETANLAPESVQDERARAVWANGAGHTHWGI